MSVEELQSVVSRLSADELYRFSEWFEEFLAVRLDRRIEQDVHSGRLEAAVTRSNERFAAD